MTGPLSPWLIRKAVGYSPSIIGYGRDDFAGLALTRRLRMMPRFVQAKDFNFYLERTVALHKRSAATLPQVNNPRFALPDRTGAIRLLLNGHA